MDWFFLAMAHQQLGNKDEARKWYDQAVKWMEKPREKNAGPSEDELRRFQVEAAEVLGVQSSPKKDSLPHPPK